MGPGLPERLKRQVLDLFYPRLTCPVCGGFGEGLCPECRSRLRRWGEEAGVDERCRGASLYRHDEAATKLINRYKLGSGFTALEVMGTSLSEAYGTHVGTFDLVSFAPSSKASLKRLRFDHGCLLARAVAFPSGVPVVPLFSPPEKEQKQLEREERRENVRTISFLPQGKGKGRIPSLRGKRVLVVDDVMTTGNTLEACMALIRQAGGEAEYLTFSRV